MHPYHIPEYSQERVASKLRSARQHEMVHLAQATKNDDPCAERETEDRRGFRIPFLNWEVITRPGRPAGASR